MYRLDHPWLLALLPLPLLIYWLLPAYKEEQDSLRLTFFSTSLLALASLRGPEPSFPEQTGCRRLSLQSAGPRSSRACAASIRRASHSKDRARA